MVQPATIPAPSSPRAQPTTGKRHRDAPLRVRLVMGPMTKVLNPLIRRAAGRKHMSMVARIQHQGRHSRRTYVTPTGARPTPDGFLVPLTFGDSSDWCRNVLVAGHCTIRYKAINYFATNPVLLVQEEGRAAAKRTFQAYERLMFKLIGVRKFLHLDAVRTR